MPIIEVSLVSGANWSGLSVSSQKTVTLPLLSVVLFTIIDRH